jgi:LacI family transcriptional regulator
VRAVAQNLRDQRRSPASGALAVKSPHVAVVLPQQANPFVEALTAEFARLGSDKATVTLVRSSSFRASDVVAAISVVPSSVSAVILIAPDVPAVHDALRRFRQNQIPIIALASPLSSSDAYVGTNNWISGRIAAQIVSRFVGGASGTVAVIKSNLSYRGTDEREMGFRAVLAHDAPHLRVVTVEGGISGAHQGESSAAEFFRAHADLCAIYNAGGPADGIANALTSAGREDVVFVSHDLGVPTRKFLLSGVLDAVIAQSPPEEAAQAIALAERFLLHGTDVSAQDRHVILPTNIVLRESLS